MRRFEAKNKLETIDLEGKAKEAGLSWILSKLISLKFLKRFLELVLDELYEK